MRVEPLARAKGAVARLMCALILPLALAACAGAPAQGQGRVAAQREAPSSERVLFVGNSLTYRNDLPAQFAAIAARALGRPVEVEMIAGGGERIDQHAARGVAQRALASGRYSALVLQEWSPGLLCDPQFETFGFDCAASRAAHRALADTARRDGARVVLLGTYSQVPGVAEALAGAEADFARELGAQYASLREFPALRAEAPARPWLDADGAHPGIDLTLLMALEVSRALYGDRALDALASEAPFAIRYRDYRDQATPEADAPVSAQTLAAPVRERTVTHEDLEALRATAR